MNGNISTWSENCQGENDNVPIVDSFKLTKSHCIFCAKECPTAFVIEHGKLLRMKEEMELNSFGCENAILARQLRAINIMRNILDIRKETCFKLLAQFDGQFNPEFWVKVCVSCKVFVEEINTIRREVARLEKEANHLKEKLKGFISTSNEDEELDVDSPLCREIREEVLAEFEPTPPELLIMEDEMQQGEPPVMEVEVGPAFRVKTELPEEPGSWTRVTRKRTVKAKQAATVAKRKKVGATKKIKTRKATEKPMATQGTGESEANSVELNTEPEVENRSDTAAEELTPANKIEQKLLSFFTEWNTHISYSYLDLDLDTRIPSLWIKFNPPNPEGKSFAELLNSVVVPGDGRRAPTANYYYYSKSFSLPGMNGFEKRSQNPFPTSFLRFGMRRWKVPTSLIPDSKVQRKILSIFKKFGSFLTILVLDNYWVHSSKFAELLSHLPNLKSLSLEAVQFQGGDESSNWSVSTLPPLQHLTHLRCIAFGYNNVVCGPLKPEHLLWILEKYGNQLIGLTLSGHRYLYSEHVERLEKTVKFEKLKQLKIDCSNTDFLKLTRESELSHIMVERVDKFGNFLPNMLPLIERFSKTLEYLRLPTEIGVFEQNDGAVVRFTKLKELAIIVSSEFFGFQNLLESRFHALEKLHCIHYVELCPAVEAVVKDGKCWELSRNLKTVTYFDDQDNFEGEEYRTSIKGRTHVPWSRNRSQQLWHNNSSPMKLCTFGCSSPTPKK